VGFVIQRRLYFIGGAVFLLIAVFLNTLRFWLNIPWWIYLLTGGALLIFFASKNELNKRNKRESIIGKFIKKVRMW
jgi:cell division protein FtsW (lipid II flippase)